MKYLVTGGAGFIGSHLVEALLLAKHKVVVLDDFSTGKHENIPDGVELLEGDILDADLVVKACKGIDGCFHLAAVASVTRSMEDWAHTHQINQSGAVNIFEQAGKADAPVVYASSAAVYGDSTELPLQETVEVTPLSPYGLDKLLCESQAAMGSHVVGLKSAGMRFFNVYGPCQDPKSPYSGVISIFMERYKQRQAITIFGDGEQTRDFIYVSDVVAHLIAAMQGLEKGEFSQEVMNVCTGNPKSIKEIAIILGDTAGNTVDIGFDTAREGDIKHSLGDSGKAKSLLKLRAEKTVEEGLKETWLNFYS